MIKLIPIKPPRDALDVARIAAAVERGLDTAARGVQADFERTTATWDHGVSFDIQKAPGERTIGTDDDIYGYVEHGTKAHDIRPRRKRILVFPSGYRAKTSPGVIGSGGGSRGSGRIIARRVRHPGAKARRFSEAIAEKWDRGPLRDTIQHEIDGAVR